MSESPIDQREQTDPAILLRRTEKEWRHEDREISGTLALGRIAVAIQGAFIPITGAIIKDSPTDCERVLFVLIVLFSLASIACCIAIPYLIVRYDRKSAWYYSITGSGAKPPAGFDSVVEEEKRRGFKKAIDDWRPRLELAQAIFFTISTILFVAAIVIHR